MKSDTSKTMLTISMGFLALYLVFIWKWALAVSIIIGVIGITSSFLSKRIEWVWLKLAEVLSLIVPKIVLTLAFFLFLFPIALLYRIFNKDPLMLSRKYDSYFLEVKRDYDKKSFEKTW